MFDFLRRRPRVRAEHLLDTSIAPGTQWDGPHAWSTDFPHTVPMAGFYALTDDGKQLRRPLIRLVGVDDAPPVEDATLVAFETGDGVVVQRAPHDLNGAWHLEVAGPDDPPQRSAGAPVESKRDVALDAHVIGEGDTGGSVT